MHSWRENVNLLEMVGMPGVVGYQADMAHSMLFVLGANAEKDRILPADFDWSDKAALDAAYHKVADALRPWTLDFHVAQNDGTTFGSGDHEKTGRHCQVDDPERPARCRQARRLLAARRQRQPHQDDAPHLLGRLHVPQRGDGDARRPGTRFSAPDGQGARRARLARIGDGARTKMAAKQKTLNIGMVGYGFMARAHSNAWASVSHFFDTGYQPVLKAVAARNASKAQALRRAVGL